MRLKQYQSQFAIRRANFSKIKNKMDILFDTSPTSWDDPVPELDYGRNHAIVSHSEFLRTTIDKVNAIPVYGDMGLISNQVTLLQNLQSELDGATRTIHIAWRQLVSKQLNLQNKNLIVADAGKHLHRPSLSATHVCSQASSGS